ncbi:hypothetical protein GCM10023345_06180 [Acinetobacter kookii]
MSFRIIKTGGIRTLYIAHQNTAIFLANNSNAPFWFTNNSISITMELKFCYQKQKKHTFIATEFIFIPMLKVGVHFALFRQRLTR